MSSEQRRPSDGDNRNVAAAADLLDNGDAAAAVALLISDAPTTSLASLSLLASAQIRMGKSEEAIESLRAVIARASQQMGDLLLGTGADDAALAAFRSSLAIGGDNAAADLRFLLDRLARAPGWDDLGEEILEYRESEFERSEGITLQEQGDLDSALDHFMEAINKGNALAHANVGQIHELRGHTDEAVEAYQEGMAEEDGTSALQMARLLESRGDLSAAIAAATDGVRFGDATCALYLGMTYEEQGDIPAARAAFRQAGELGDGDGLYRLGSIDLDADDLASAIEHFSWGARLGSSDAAFNLGAMLEESGDFAEALDAFVQARDLGEDDEELEEIIASLRLKADPT